MLADPNPSDETPDGVLVDISIDPYNVTVGALKYLVRVAEFSGISDDEKLGVTMVDNSDEMIDALHLYVNARDIHGMGGA